MYSEELKFYIDSKNSVLSSEEYVFVTDMNRHPQINHIKYNPWDNSTDIWTKDCYHYQVRVNLA
jgi:hypothetical protein